MANEKKKGGKATKDSVGFHGKDISSQNATPGINTPGIELPAFNPPVPNRAWTAMRNGVDIDALSEEEKADLYIGNDNQI
jgi:hypothetical protein